MRINLHIEMQESNEQEHIVQGEHQSDQVTSESIKQETQKESQLPNPLNRTLVLTHQKGYNTSGSVKTHSEFPLCSLKSIGARELPSLVA